MKREKPEAYSRKVTVRLTPSEYGKLQTKFKETTARKFSEFIRDILLNKPVTVKTRNLSADEFLKVALALKNDLSGIANNYNQAVKKINQSKTSAEINFSIARYEKEQAKLLMLLDEIKEQMHSIYLQWSQK